jgi:hypothetical protein
VSNIQNPSEILDDVLNEQNNAADTAEANDQTVPEGNYLLNVMKAAPELASDKSPWEGRLMVRCRIDCIDKTTNLRVGSVFADLSPDVIRTDSGRQDPASVLWANAVQTLKMPNASKREIIDSLTKFPFEGFVTRTFKFLGGPGERNSYRKPKSKEEEREFLEAGGKPTNFLKNLRPAR